VDGDLVEELSSPPLNVVVAVASAALVVIKVITAPKDKYKVLSRSVRNNKLNLVQERKDKFHLIVDPEYFWVVREVASYPFEYISRKSIEESVSYFNVCFDIKIEFISAETCNNLDKVFMKSLPINKTFTFVYKFFFKKLNVLFLLSPFESKMLNFTLIVRLGPF